jgi:hypothetical protein
VNRDHLFALFDEARRLTGHTDYVVIGSLSVLGTQDEDELPADMAISIDVDAYTLADPGRIGDARAALGEGSVFHRRHGYFLDPVSPGLPCLPDGWRARMTSHERGGVRLWFLDPDDAAVSKYARGQPNDARWIRAGISSGLISLPKLEARLATTTFLDDTEATRLRARVEADKQWFAAAKTRRGRVKR